MGSVAIYHDTKKASEPELLTPEQERELKTQIALLKAQNVELSGNVSKGDSFRGKTDLQYTLERVQTRWHAREVFAKRAAIRVANIIKAKGMQEFWQLNECKFARDLLRMEQCAETHMELALELVAELVNGL